MTEKMVENHEKTLVEHEEVLGKVRATQGVLADEIVKVKRNIGQMVGEINEIRQRQQAEEDPEPAFSWYTYASQDQAISVLAELDWFVSSVLVHIKGGALTDCWRRHPQVVDMLLVLTESYLIGWGSTTRVGARLDFYTRYLPGILDQVNTILGTCSLRSPIHNGGRKPSVQEGIDDFMSFEMAWRLDRGNPPIPEVPDDVQAESRWRGSQNEREEMNR